MTTPVPPSLKPGVRSSELWLSILTVAADGVVAFLHVDVTRYVPTIAIVLPQIAVLAYVVGRTLLKFRWPSSPAARAADLGVLSEVETAAKAALADIEAHKDELIGLARTVTRIAQTKVDQAPPTAAGVPLPKQTPVKAAAK